jgi:hypothetical protein
MYDMEKTVCDLFENEKRVGKDVVKEVLDNYLSRRERNLVQLTQYAARLGMSDSFAQTLAYLL